MVRKLATCWEKFVLCLINASIDIVSGAYMKLFMFYHRGLSMSFGFTDCPVPILSHNEQGLAQQFATLHIHTNGRVDYFDSENHSLYSGV